MFFFFLSHIAYQCGSACAAAQKLSFQINCIGNSVHQSRQFIANTPKRQHLSGRVYRCLAWQCLLYIAMMWRMQGNAASLAWLAHVADINPCQYVLLRFCESFATNCVTCDALAIYYPIRLSLNWCGWCQASESRHWCHS